MDRKEQISEPDTNMSQPTESASTSPNPGSPKGRRFDETFKRDAVRLREQSGRPRAQVARDLGYPSTVELADGSLVSVWYEHLPGETLASVQAAHWALSVQR